MMRTTVTRAGHGHRREHIQYHCNYKTKKWEVMKATPTENGYKFTVIKQGFLTKAAAKRWWLDAPNATEPMEDEAPGAVWKP